MRSVAILAAILLVLGSALGYVLLRPPAPQPAPPIVPQQNASAAMAEARQYYSTQRIAEAKVIVREILSGQPDFPDAHLLLAEILLGEDDFSGARSSADVCLAQKQFEADAHFIAGLASFRLGDYPKSVEHHQASVALAPQEPKHTIYLANALLAMERIDEASEQADRARKLDANLAEGFYLDARIAEVHGELDKALMLAAKAAGRIDPTDNHLTLEYAMYRSQLLRRTDKPGEALNVLTALEPKLLNNERAAEELAACYMQRNEPGKAAMPWLKMFLLDPTNTRAAAEAGYYLLENGNRKEADRYLLKAEQLDPTHPAVERLRKRLAASS